MTTNINNNIQAIRKQITIAATTANRDAASIQLLAVSKKRAATEIEQAFFAGQKLFAESYVQEALPKIAALKKYTLEWHFIGPIQANKTKLIAANFSWAHSVDRIKIAQRLNDQRPKNLPPLNICIQIKTSAEEAKSGITATELPQLAAATSQASFVGNLELVKYRSANYNYSWSIVNFTRN